MVQAVLLPVCPTPTHPCLTSPFIFCLLSYSPPFLKDALNCSVFSSVKFCFELSSLTPAIWQNPSFHPPLSALLWFVRKGARCCCTFPKGKPCIYLLASRIRNLSESVQSSAFFISSVNFLVSLDRLRLLCCFHQGR